MEKQTDRSRVLRPGPFEVAPFSAGSWLQLFWNPRSRESWRSLGFGALVAVGAFVPFIPNSDFS